MLRSPGATAPHILFTWAGDLQTSHKVPDGVKRAGWGSDSNLSNSLAAGQVKIAQDIKDTSVSKNRFGKSKRQTKKPWKPNFKATLWQQDMNVRLMARGKLAVFSNTSHIFWICWTEWRYSKAMHQWTWNSLKTSEASVISGEITSKAEEPVIAERMTQTYTILDRNSQETQTVRFTLIITM